MQTINVLPEVELRQKLSLGTRYFGHAELVRGLGLGLDSAQVPHANISEEEVELLQTLDMQVMYLPDRDVHGPLTMQRFHDVEVGGEKNRLGNGKLLYAVDWYLDQPFYTIETPRPRFVKMNRGVIEGATGVNFLKQTDAIEGFVVNKLFANRDLPNAYGVAIEEFRSQREKIDGLMRKGDLLEASNALAALRLNRLRGRPVEELLSLILNYIINQGERLLANVYSWTATQTVKTSRTDAGNLVFLGYCDSDGVLVDGFDPGYENSDLGVRLFCPEDGVVEL